MKSQIVTVKYAELGVISLKGRLLLSKDFMAALDVSPINGQIHRGTYITVSLATIILNTMYLD